jgi:hypothetical protein
MFYSRLGVAPEEVGLGYGEVLAQSLVAIVLFVGFLAALLAAFVAFVIGLILPAFVVGVWIGFLLDKRTRRLAMVLVAVAAILFYLYVFPSLGGVFSLLSIGVFIGFIVSTRTSNDLSLRHFSEILSFSTQAIAMALEIGSLKELLQQLRALLVVLFFSTSLIVLILMVPTIVGTQANDVLQGRSSQQSGIFAILPTSAVHAK